MYGQYAFLRSQYEKILTYCDYLLRHSIDAQVLEKALASNKRAQEYLEWISRKEA